VKYLDNTSSHSQRTASKTFKDSAGDPSNTQADDNRKVFPRSATATPVDVKSTPIKPNHTFSAPRAQSSYTGSSANKVFYLDDTSTQPSAKVIYLDDTSPRSSADVIYLDDTSLSSSAYVPCSPAKGTYLDVRPPRSSADIVYLDGTSPRSSARVIYLNNTSNIQRKKSMGKSTGSANSTTAGATTN
jgi:hypothetical protein